MELGRGCAACNTTPQTTSRPEQVASTINKLITIALQLENTYEHNMFIGVGAWMYSYREKVKTTVTLLQTKQLHTHRYYCWKTIIKYLYIIYILFLLRQLNAFLMFQVRFTHRKMTSVPLSHALSTCYSGSMLVSVHLLIQIPLLLSRDNATKKRQRISTVIILLFFESSF